MREKADNKKSINNTNDFFFSYFSPNSFSSLSFEIKENANQENKTYSYNNCFIVFCIYDHSNSYSRKAQELSLSRYY